MKIKVVNKSNNELPSYATVGSAGMDIRSFIPDIPAIGIKKKISRWIGDANGWVFSAHGTS